MSFRRALVGLLASASVAAVLATTQSGTAAPGTEARSCAWALKVDPAGANVLYPDENAHYWILALPLTAGQELVLRGRYPHSRYISFVTYGGGARSADALSDVEIAPDPGSTNPFVQGARRTATKRSFTVHVVQGNRPARPAPNTLYTGTTDNPSRGGSVVLAYRNYREDKGYDDKGGVGLPDVSVVTDGREVALPRCDAPVVPPNDLNEAVASVPAPPYPGVVGRSQPVWRKFRNLGTTVVNASEGDVTGTAISDLLAPIAAGMAQGGFGDNPDNKYVSTLLSSGLGDVVIIRGTLPRFADTRGAKRMPAGQVRYWSMCSNELGTTRYYACLVDDQLPITAKRRFTIVVSTAEDRPANARPECGIAWLPMGPVVDTVLIVRNMLPGAGFRHSIQRARFGHEREDLGKYYPRTHYASVAEAERLGCASS